MHVSRTIFKAVGTMAMVAAIGLGTSKPAQALPCGISGGGMCLELYDGTTTVTVYDGGVGDANSAPDAITFVGSVGVWVVNVSTGLAIVNTPGLGVIDLNSINVSTGAGSLTMTLYDENFNLTSFPGLATGISSIGGTLGGGSTITVGAAVAGSLLPGMSFSTPGAFSGTTYGTVAGVNPFTMLIQDTITNTGAASTSFDHQLEAAAVPEPATLALLGSGLIGIARRRRAKK